MANITLYNSLTNEKEVFIPIQEGLVKMYCCGPTVYNYAHIGNFRAYIFSDLIHRVLLDAGYNVKLVMNLTDVDDKTIRGSREKKMKLSDYTEVYKKAFFDDIKILRIKPAAEYPAATDNIKEMLRIIKLLEKNGHTYVADGSVYFKISSFKNYGELASLDKQELQSGASGRVSSDEYEKENASDFVLWKAHAEDDGDVWWESEYGKGRPGWHIECSAMSEKYLGAHFDIHTGGVDNKFPHHENEIAQNECAFGVKFVNYWLHCEHLIVDGQKMSKSKGNFFTLRDLIDKGLDMKGVRYLLLSSHYRKQLNFTIEGVTNAAKAIERVNDLIFRLKDITKTDGDDSEIIKGIDEYEKVFTECMYDDLNSAGALGALFELVKFLNTNFDKISVKSKLVALKFITRVNNIIDCFNLVEENIALDDEIETLIKERGDARKNKNYKRSDEIRDMLLERGVELLDTPEGTKWKKK